MAIQKDAIQQKFPINPVKTTTFICHICFKTCNSSAGRKIHLRSHGRQNEGGAISNDMESEGKEEVSII